ncbi:MAG TPA: phosphatase PAP2 family protein [Actinomycetota bacterium]|jgi:membrane-associated phospholipid phosphatase/tRNA A-37 threonylcarbamoyl transferase component Bud32
MDVPAGQSTPVNAPPVHPTLHEAVRAPRRRRPTGAPPPLPYRLQTSGVGWLVAAVVMVGLVLAVFGRGLRGPAITATVASEAVVRWLGGLRAPGLEALWQGLAHLGSWWTLVTLSSGLLLALLLLRRWRHLIVWLVAWILAGNVAVVLAMTAQRPRPFGVSVRASWGGWAMPSLHVTYLAALLVAILYTLVPEGRWRNTGKRVAVALVALVVLARIALGVDAPNDVLVGVGIGVAIPLLLFRRFTPGEVFPVAYRRGRSAHLDIGGARGTAIRRALQEQLGLVVQDVRPFGLAGSAGSTPLRITVKGADGEPPKQLFGKLYAQGHLRADRWYKLGRELLYGRLEDEKPFNSVRRLVQQEDYALKTLYLAGLPSPTPFGFVELTPEREYLLVTEFFAGAVELGEAQVDDAVIDDGLAIVRRLWDAGLAHRDVKPANLLVRDGRLLLIDVAFAEARPSPWRQAVDLANMMLCLALRSSPERVYRRALRQFTVEEVTEAFARLTLPGGIHPPWVALGLALPSQLRHMLRAQSRDPYPEFVKLLPNPPRTIPIQRWSARRVGLWLAIVAVLALAALNSKVVFDNRMAVRTPLYINDLDCTHLEPLWLMAQSVPSASLLPCVESRLPGWTVADVAVNDGRTVVILDHDRAGKGAVVVRLTAACDATGAVETPSPAPGVRRDQLVESLAGEFSATWYDRFPGGCVTYRLHSTSDLEGQFANEAPSLLGFTTRAALSLALGQRSDGRLQLDPAEAR